MTRARVLGLLAVLVALAVAIAYGVRDRATPAAAAPDLAPLRASAALAPCPAGISPELPALELPCLAGGDRAPLRGTPAGRPVLVNVYGSWCGPCQAEMPVLRAFHAATPGVGLVGIDTEDDRSTALHFAIDFQQHWPALADDDGTVLRRFGSGAPQMLFVDAQGRIKHVARGGYKDLASLRADVRTYLGVAT